jgi:hypothetical protein
MRNASALSVIVASDAGTSFRFEAAFHLLQLLPLGTRRGDVAAG